MSLIQAFREPLIDYTMNLNGGEGHAGYHEQSYGVIPSIDLFAFGQHLCNCPRTGNDLVVAGCVLRGRK